MKLSKYKQRHAEIVGALVAMVDMIHEVKMGLDAGLELVEESAEIAATIDRDNRAMTLLASQRESAEKEMARVGELLQKERDDLNKRKERSVAQAKDWDKELAEKRAKYTSKENSITEEHKKRMDGLKSQEAELKASIARMERVKGDIEKSLSKLKASIGEIE